MPMQPSLATSTPLLERYRRGNSADGLLGEGSSCVVYKALAYDGSSVAVKAFRVKSRSQEHQELQERYQKEVAIFKLLGLGPGGPGQHDENPRRLFVNLLDYSRNQAGTPGPEKDGKFYMILELGHESLDMWLRTTGFIRMANFIEIARSLLAALEFLHGLGFVHLDVKPDNIMRFGSLWKLIDLGSCLYVGDVVPLDGFTPLYCSPELAEAALEESEANPGPLRWPLRARPAMDLWAAGVVLLDVLVQGCCFAETKASLDLVDLFADATPFEGWYRWLASTEPIDLRCLVAETPGAALLNAELCNLLDGLLQKEQDSRPSAASVLRHPLLEPGGQKPCRQKVELAFRKAKATASFFSADQLMMVLQCIGVEASDASRLLGALKWQDDSDKYSLNLFLDFLYSSNH
mmetsp:Transcript_146296/g.207459  ORF Transcript_146296/g.207459 Transcript_146296/m.207459 type:complete len:406 (+) Transcript_146296:97-1314(+)